MLCLRKRQLTGSVIADDKQRVRFCPVFGNVAEDNGEKTPLEARQRCIAVSARKQRVRFCPVFGNVVESGGVYSIADAELTRNISTIKALWQSLPTTIELMNADAAEDILRHADGSVPFSAYGCISAWLVGRLLLLRPCASLRP